MHDAFIQAIINIHRMLPRKGPGSDHIAETIFDYCAPFLGKSPVMADFGCGNGHSSFKLVEYFDGTVRAVDFAAPFLQELKERLKGHPCERKILPVQGDMLDPTQLGGPYDLIWSEGATAIVGTVKALETWYPLLKPDGLLVYSEASWRLNKPQPEAVEYYETRYSDLTDHQGHIQRAEAIGFKVLKTMDLPTEDWWTSYFHPLQRRVEELSKTVEPGSALSTVINSFHEETRMFERFSDQYGYTFFVLQKN